MSILENLIIGALGSLIASVVFLIYTSYRDKKAIKKKYAASIGKYIGYGTTEPQGTILNEERPLSHVKITYEGGNLLKIVLKEM
ncbi:hypothetical protein [Algoriphagus persicinus]|uniref:hypothetical protein n=1 Tax=Algoriphagus persicinus TaxID=3108754 RepID=UPI002B3E531F|nr:hypothetical protein [Algoriphagus sp. E1-3-M2]MEB2785218.1 hypothetical protein [Algoriphagus sp. E1-3-M2]